MHKKKLIMCFFLVILFFTGGCWSLEEVEDLAIVGITGLDKVNTDSDEKWHLNSKIVKPGAGGGGESGGGGQQQQSEDETEWLVKSTGVTISKAVNNVSSRSSRVIYTAHTDPYIIGENVARRDIKGFVDYIMRDPDMRLIPWLLITEGKASKVIETGPNMENTLSEEINSAMDNSLNRMNKAPKINIKDFISSLTLEGRDAVIPRISVANSSGTNKTIQISGMGVFKKDKLVGWMNSAETKGYLYITGDAKQEVISVESNKQKFSVFMKSFSSTINPVKQNDRVSFSVKIEAKSSLEEIPARNLTSREIDSLEEKLQQKIKERAEEAIRKARDEYNADIFGFGEVLHKKHPEIWNENKQNWYNIYSTIKVNVTAEAEIVNTGMIKNLPEF